MMQGAGIEIRMAWKQQGSSGDVQRATCFSASTGRCEVHFASSSGASALPPIFRKPIYPSLLFYNMVLEHRQPVLLLHSLSVCYDFNTTFLCHNQKKTKSDSQLQSLRSAGVIKRQAVLCLNWRRCESLQLKEGEILH